MENHISNPLPLPQPLQTMAWCQDTGMAVLHRKLDRAIKHLRVMNMHESRVPCTTCGRVAERRNATLIYLQCISDAIWRDLTHQPPAAAGSAAVPMPASPSPPPTQPEAIPPDPPALELPEQLDPSW